MWNLLKVNNTDFRTKSMTLFCCLYCWLWADSHIHLVFLLFNFDVCWDNNKNSNDYQSHDEDVGRADFTTNLIQFFEVGGQWPRSVGRGPRTWKPGAFSLRWLRMLLCIFANSHLLGWKCNFKYIPRVLWASLGKLFLEYLWKTDFER